MHRIKRKFITIPLLISILFSSCTFTYKKPDSDKIDEFFARVNAYGEKYEAKISLIDNSSLQVQNLYMQLDSTSFASSKTGRLTSIVTSDIRFIEFRDPGVGAIGGLTTGLIVGLLAAIVSILLFMNDDNGGHPNTGPLVALIYGPIIGGTVGLIYGAIREDTKIFIINPEN
jgi:hypothetical protein